MKAYCYLCDATIEKPRWEHLINWIYRNGGNAGTGKCPHCKHKDMLEFDLKEGG